MDTATRRRLLRPSWGALIATVLALTAGPAAAAENDQMSVTPTAEGGAVRPWLSYQTERGSVIDDSITIANKGIDDLELELYAVDAAVTTDGTFAPTRRDAAHDSVGAWVSLETDSVLVPPGESVDVGFRFVVPDLTEPGDYAGLIIAQFAEDEELTTEQGGLRLGVESGVGVKLFARVDGDLRPGLSVSGVRIVPDGSFGRWFGASVAARIEYTVTNTGNIRLVPIAGAEVTGPFGSGRIDVPDQTLPDLLPGGSVRISDEIGDVAPALLLRADVDVRSPDGLTTASSTGRRVLVPWIALVLAVVFVFWIARQARRLRVYLKDRRTPDRWEMGR
jgi:hypothetical protein